MRDEQATGVEIEIPGTMMRYSGLVDVRAILGSRVAIIGCGAVGRQTARQLASMGVRQFLLIDPDDVADANVGSQGWPAGSVGDQKVDALADELDVLLSPMADTGFTELPDDVDLEVISDEYDAKDLAEYGPTHVFVCVDNMEVRRQVVEEWALGVFDARAVFEARMGAQTAVVHTLLQPAHVERWMREWYPQAEAEEADTTTCTTKATIFCASLAGAMMCKSFFDVLRDVPVPFQYGVDMSAHVSWAEKEDAPSDDKAS